MRIVRPLICSAVLAAGAAGAAAGLGAGAVGAFETGPAACTCTGAAGVCSALALASVVPVAAPAGAACAAGGAGGAVGASETTGSGGAEERGRRLRRWHGLRRLRGVRRGGDFAAKEPTPAAGASITATAVTIGPVFFGLCGAAVDAAPWSEPLFESWVEALVESATPGPAGTCTAVSPSGPTM